MGPLVVPLVMAGIQAATGIAQRASAKRRREAAMGKMDYDISSGTKEQVQIARERASRSGLPGEDVTRARLESEAAQTISKGESVSTTSGDVLGLYQKMYGNKMDINRQILEKGSQYKSENELQLMKTMGLMGEEENQQFYYNRMVPFLSDMRYAGEEAAGGSANIAGGLQTAYQGWMNNFMTQQFDTGVGEQGIDFDTLKLQQKASYYGQPATEKPLETDPWMTDESMWGNLGAKRNKYGPNYPAY